MAMTNCCWLLWPALSVTWTTRVAAAKASKLSAISVVITPVIGLIANRPPALSTSE